MEYFWFTKLLMLTQLLYITDGLTVSPEQHLSNGNCSGKFDEFLCNCLVYNDTIDINLSPGQYNFSQNQTCILQNKNKIKITGNSVRNTSIYCNDFNLVFNNTQNVLISNIEMVGCGSLASDMINQSFTDAVPVSYFGEGSRFTIMFIFSFNVTISNLIVRNNFGYSIIALNALGVVRLSQVYIINTTFEQDINCKDLGHDPKTDFSCSGSGVLFSYFDLRNPPGFNSSLLIENYVFERNRNIVSLEAIEAFSDVVNTAYYRENVPIIGAGCIALYYVQHNFTVTTNISGTLFYNNNGTLSATVGIAHLQSTLGITNLHNCTFEDNNRISLAMDENEIYGSQQRGGIVLLYFIARGGLNISSLLIEGIPHEVEMLTVSNCRFIKLGGNRGAAIYIEKLSNDYITIATNIFHCEFIQNECDAGSAVFAKDNHFLVSESGGGVKIGLVNVVAVFHQVAL